MANKMTKRDYFNRILSYAHDEDKAFIEHELELLAKKNSSDKKQTATQRANEEIKAAIVSGVGENAWTIGEICKNVDACKKLSSQKVSALVRQLVIEDKMVRTEIKRKAYFSVKA